MFIIAISLVGIVLCHGLLLKTQGALPFGVPDACTLALLCIFWPLACFDCKCACCKLSQIPAYCNYQLLESAYQTFLYPALKFSAVPAFDLYCLLNLLLTEGPPLLVAYLFYLFDNLFLFCDLTLFFKLF